MSTNPDVSTVPMERLYRLSTNDLIKQYELAISSWKGRITNTSPRQRRIDFICEMLLDRAENYDTEARAWLDEGREETT